MTEPQGESGRRVDPARVLAKLQQLDDRLVQLAVLQVIAEDQEETIAALRAELVKATAGPAGDG